MKIILLENIEYVFCSLIDRPTDPDNLNAHFLEAILKAKPTNGQTK